MGEAPNEKFRDAAIDRFKSLLKENPDYWKTANAFDTMVDFLTYCSKDRKSDAASAARWLIARKGYDPSQTWFDDYGWWTAAVGRAARSQLFDNAAELAQIAQDCWKRFTGSAPFVWERHQQGTFTDCAPAVPEGVWNGYWQGTDTSRWPGPDAGDPNSGTLLGIQNSVTNEVYLLSANALGDGHRFDQEFGFLWAWLTMPANQGPLFWQLDGTSALVRERVSHYQDKPAPGFEPEWAWTGDQGLMLQALVFKAISVPPGPSRDDLIRRMDQILAGARLRLAENNVLNPWTTTGKVPTSNKDDPKANYDDYKTGTGVFWRSVLRVWDLNWRQQSISRYFKTVLQACADAAVDGSLPRPEASGQNWVTLTNELAVLVAAYALLPKMQ